MVIHAYSIPPIDGWTGLRSATDYLHQAVHDVSLFDSDADIDGINAAVRSYERTLEEFRTLLLAARRAATAVGWEGDLEAGPFVLVTPAEPTVRLTGFVWKQADNGTTFVMSLHPVPGLDSFAYEVLDVTEETDEAPTN